MKVSQVSSVFTVIVIITLVLGSCNQKQGDNLITKAAVPQAVRSTTTTSSTVSAENMEIRVEENMIGFNPKEYFEKFCSGCHGQRMKTFVDRQWMYGSTQTDIEKSIAKGMVNEGMPAYEKTLKPEEITILAQYIRQGIDDRMSYDVVEENTPKNYVTDYYNVEVDTVVSGIEIPWGIKVLADGTIFFTERKGTFNVKRPGEDVIEIKGAPKATAYGQGGMMDVALHPNYNENGWIYLSYTKANKLRYTTVVVRGKIRNNNFVEQEDIFEALPYVTTRYHFGSRMVFDREGFLYITVGDRGKRDDHPQFLSNACGKVHRLHDDGSIPKDNPFFNEPDAVKSIWSYGHRNPQGMIYDKTMITYGSMSTGLEVETSSILSKKKLTTAGQLSHMASIIMEPLLQIRQNSKGCDIQSMSGFLLWLQVEWR